jgi:hypothetical protein
LRYHHNLLLRAGINPAPTTSKLISLVGAGFTPAHQARASLRAG